MVTHWKKLTSQNYMGAYDLQPDQEVKVKIESVKQEMVKFFDGKKVEESDCLVARYVGAKKPMILNKTNCKIITRKFGTPYVEEWIGKEIIIYAAKVKAFGEVTDALRIKA